MLPPILVTVRYSSSRLPGKCMIPVQGKPILQHLLERVTTANLHPVICTSTDPTDDVIVELASKIGVEFFRGPLFNKIARWAECGQALNSEFVHIIDADDPFVDIPEILESIDEARVYDLDLLSTSDRSDRGYASVGMTLKSKFLSTLSFRVESLNSDNLDVIPWDLLLKDSDKVSKKADNVLIPDSRLNLRLTLDYETDLELISTLIIELGNSISRLDLENYLELHPDLATINSENASLFLQNKKKQLKDNFNLG